MKFNVFCIQTCSSDDLENNIKEIDKLFQKIKNKKPDLICLPECVAIMTDSYKLLNKYFSNKKTNLFLDYIKEMSVMLNSYILIGSIPFKKDGKKFLNRSILLDPNGKLVCYYDKKNLFDVILGKKEKYLESRLYDPGKSQKLYNLPWGKIGLSICYDLRFPEFFRKLTKKGAIFLSVPAAFTLTTGKVHWESLLRARAIENGCYIFAPAQCGSNLENRQTFGHSMIIDPWGKVMVKATNKPTVISAEIDVNYVKEIRKKIPSIVNYNF